MTRDPDYEAYPATTAGRYLAAQFAPNVPYTLKAAYDAITAIEREARAQERERLRAAVEGLYTIFEPTDYDAAMPLVERASVIALLDDPV